MAYNMKRGNSAVPFKQLGSSPVKQIPGDPGDKKIHQKEPSIDVFTKGARTKGGDVTAEKGKMTEYTKAGGDYVKTVKRKKKGSKPGYSEWETKKTKKISAKKAERQIKRKSKRHAQV